MERVADPTTVQAPTAQPYTEVIAFVLMAAVLIVAPLFAYPVFLMKALCFALFACAFNLLIGYVGLLSFGHALFFGWASYVSAYAAKVWGFPPELAILAGTATGAGLGVIVGALAIRRQGIYFAMITLALAQMMFFFAVQVPFTGVEDGIQAVPRGKLFGFIDLTVPINMYFTVLVIFLGCFLLIYRIINSPFGEVLKAIRENEPRAISLGYHTDRYKLIALVLSATFAGAAGATKAIVFQLASLSTGRCPARRSCAWWRAHTIFGPVVGAFFMITLEKYLTTIDNGCSWCRAHFVVWCAAVPPRHRRRACAAPAHQL
jgi:branched-chain amino acid transport system permease protein